jgi:hypothetical protein
MLLWANVQGRLSESNKYLRRRISWANMVNVPKLGGGV